MELRARTESCSKDVNYAENPPVSGTYPPTDWYMRPGRCVRKGEMHTERMMRKRAEYYLTSARFGGLDRSLRDPP